MRPIPGPSEPVRPRQTEGKDVNARNCACVRLLAEPGARWRGGDRRHHAFGRFGLNVPARHLLSRGTEDGHLEQRAAGQRGSRE